MQLRNSLYSLVIIIFIIILISMLSERNHYLFKNLKIKDNLYVCICCRFTMTNFNPLTKFLDENCLTRSNFMDWKRILMTVLTGDKIAHALKSDTLDLALHNGTQEQKDCFAKWHEHDEMTKCYMLTSMTNML